MIFFMKAMPAGITASSFQQKCGEWSSCAGPTPRKKKTPGMHLW